MRSRILYVVATAAMLVSHRSGTFIPSRPADITLLSRGIRPTSYPDISTPYRIGRIEQLEEWKDEDLMRKRKRTSERPLVPLSSSPTVAAAIGVIGPRLT